MRTAAASFFSGLLFAVGLGISGMTKPTKVIAFLDIGGEWDPSLAFVMFAAVAVYSVGFRLAMQREKPLFVPQFSLPTRREIDLPLVAGAAIFGIGWGIAGFCPGPAITALTSGYSEPILFCLAMVVTIAIYGRWRSMQDRHRTLA